MTARLVLGTPFVELAGVTVAYSPSKSLILQAWPWAYLEGEVDR